MAERFACERSDLISAAALVAGTMNTNLSRSCAPAQPRPIMFINGTADPIVPYDGSRFGTLAAYATYNFWQTLHNCTSSAAKPTHPKGRASCRERVCKYVIVSGGDVTSKKK